MILKFNVYWADKCQLIIYRQMQHGEIRRDFAGETIEEAVSLAAKWLGIDSDELYKKIMED